MQPTLTLSLLLVSLPFVICSTKTDFDCAFTLYKDMVPNSAPCTNEYMHSLGIMDADQCNREGGDYFYCDKINKVYPFHCHECL